LQEGRGYKALEAGLVHGQLQGDFLGRDLARRPGEGAALLASYGRDAQLPAPVLGVPVVAHASRMEKGVPPLQKLKGFVTIQRHISHGTGARKPFHFVRDDVFQHIVSALKHPGLPLHPIYLKHWNLLLIEHYIGIGDRLLPRAHGANIVHGGRKANPHLL